MRRQQRHPSPVEPGVAVAALRDALRDGSLGLTDAARVLFPHARARTAAELEAQLALVEQAIELGVRRGWMVFHDGLLHDATTRDSAA